MTLEEFLKTTDALTYINALKVTLTEVKDEVSTQEDLRDYMNQSAERTKKLIRRADNQYRLIAKIISRDAPLATNVTIRDDVTSEELEELMQEV